MASATPPVAISASPLAWLKGEIDHSIMIARENLALAAGPMGVVALEACEKHMRQVRGALQMLGMEGATRYTELIEYAIILFGTGKIRMTQESVSILDRAMFALKQFLDDIVKGEFNVPLKLFPVYRDLSELQGNDSVSEIDLFFPELSALPPPNPAARDMVPADVARYVQQQRVLFQRGLLAWLRQVGNRQGLQHMRIAVDALDQARAQTTGTPALWWIAGAFIDALTLQDTSEWTVNVKAVCGRIDRHMRDLASGTGPDDQALARELLYVVATCKPLSRRIRDVKQVFRLDAQIPDYGLTGTLEYDLAKLQPVLDDMRTRLEAIEDA
jgi:chemosensory pili system protein ChpA (sensor histidine kinase/response regulator)